MCVHVLCVLGWWGCCVCVTVCVHGRCVSVYERVCAGGGVRFVSMQGGVGGAV